MGDVSRAEFEEQRRQLEEQRRQLEEQRRQLEVESMARKYLIPPGVVTTAESVLFYLVERSPPSPKKAPRAPAPRPPVCTGFFFSRSMALTVSHNVRERSESSLGVLEGVALDGTALTFKILHEDAELDFIVLGLIAPATERPFFDVTPSPTPPIAGTSAVLFTCGIAWAAGMAPELAGPPGITLVQATVTHVGRHGRHFAYSAPMYGGDLGGCVYILDRTGHVIGMHLAGVNDIREQLSDEERMRDASSPPPPPPKKTKVDSIKESINSIVASVTTGGLALFLGCEGVRRAIRDVGAGGRGAELGRRREVVTRESMGLLLGLGLLLGRAESAVLRLGIRVRGRGPRNTRPAGAP